MALRVKTITPGKFVGGRFVASKKNPSGKTLYQFTVNGMAWGPTYKTKSSAMKHRSALKREMGKARVKLKKLKSSVVNARKTTRYIEALGGNYRAKKFQKALRIAGIEHTAIGRRALKEAKKANQ